ncbi:anti-sigma factor [Sphingomonas sp.]|uniref:anti-sigma factor family protein n=1 Tax=Sphingomonas sp. TaxID=28214 RepID=UPI0025F9AE4E|nr:zf-HC2 domain-containing protein [Sphingomonas sp.]
MSIDPEMLMAYADGELGPLEARRVERAIAEDPALGEEVARHRALRARLSGHFAPVTEEPVPDRLAAMLRSNLVELPVRKPVARIAAWMRLGGAAAASLVLGLAIGHGLRDRGVVQTRSDQLYAAGTLASALDGKLAADQGATQVPVTFRDAGGSYCRVFISRAVEGIACHDRQGWALRQTRAGGAMAKTDYVQAGSTGAAVMAAAQEMMAGAPLDATMEARARASGWR